MPDIKELQCTRCNHKWWPRSPKLPKFCSKCNSPYWNKEKKSNFPTIELSDSDKKFIAHRKLNMKAINDVIRMAVESAYNAMMEKDKKLP